MIDPNLLLIDGGGYAAPTASVPANYEIPWISIQDITDTSVTLVLSAPTSAAGSYGGSYTTYTFNDPDGVFTFTGTTKAITGLTPGASYTLRVRAYSGAGATGTYGAYQAAVFTTLKVAPVGGVTATVPGTATPSNVAKNSTEPGTSSAIRGNNQVAKSLFTVTNNQLNKNKYSLVEKDLGVSTSSNYHSFGTSMFFTPNIDSTEAGGGIGFYTSNGGMNGYYVRVQTTSSQVPNDDKDVKIIKVVNGVKIPLADSQETIAKSITGIYGATAYKIDIKVETQATARIINVFINGRKITAVDSNKAGSTDPKDNMLPKTSKFAMFASIGTSNFDYIYSIPLTSAQYSENAPLYNVYTGQYAKTTLDFLYGEKVLDNFTKTNLTNGVVDEFGTTARELRKISVKYNSRPGYPIYPSTGINNFIQILGSKLSSFGAEVYLLNNAGTYVPLDDAGMSSFSIIGNYVVQSGQHDYLESSINGYTTPEPVIFESTWIQTESDAKNLSAWIKNQWSKQQRVVDLQVFGNPLISVGDIITIKYPNNDLDGTQKFVVSSVNNSFSDGLETSITARSIYS